MSHAFGQTTAARKGVICQSASSKLLTSCLKGYSVQLVFQLVFPAYTLQLPPSCVLHPDLKKFCSNKTKRALRALLTRTRTLSSNRGLLRIDVSAPCTRESNALDVRMTKYARSSREVQENKVTLCDVGSSCNAQRNKKVTVLRSSNLSSEIHK